MRVTSACAKRAWGPRGPCSLYARCSLCALLTAASLWGCGAREAHLGDTRLELYSAEAGGTGLIALTGDQTLVPGAQGGFHVWLKFKLLGAPTGRLRWNHTARRSSDNRLLVTGDRIIEMTPTGSLQGYESPEPIPAFMCPSPLGVKVMDEPVVFQVTLSDENGNRLASATATATPRCPPGEQNAFCVRICTG